MFAVLSVLPAIAVGQENFTGVVLDSLTREALPYAAVYVNGTTKGTITDTLGLFELKNVNFPVDVQRKTLHLDEIGWNHIVGQLCGQIAADILFCNNRR